MKIFYEIKNTCVVLSKRSFLSVGRLLSQDLTKLQLKLFKNSNWRHLARLSSVHDDASYYEPSYL